ncbi:hypothetical protein BGZ60DRAFT_112268 [Tricladium varicosporioides]|nr:hypothetical protein BGZ60DRAFT_112268 [Hymenoscyphus varicosporioides]
MDRMLCQLLGKPPSIPEYCFGQRCDFSESSTFPVWTNWVTQNGLSDICSSTPSVDPGAIAQKLLDLCGIINGFHFKTTQSNINELSIKMRSQSWKELMIDDINMRLLGWHDSLPINLRCSRWSSVSEVLCPNVASMHMLYHLTQISANMPFLNLHLWSNIDSSTAQPKLVTNALIICRQATEMISSIIRRFKAQYTLTTVSLPFVQGTIVAIDACLAILSLELLDQNVTQETNLRFLDSALLEMSDTWAIASYASNGLQKILREDGILRSPSTSNISLISEGLPTPEFLEYGLFSSGELAISPSNAEHQLHTHVMSNLCTWDNQLPAGNFPEPWKVDASLENYNRNLFAEDQPDLTGFELLGAANVEETDGTMYT